MTPVGRAYRGHGNGAGTMHPDVMLLEGEYYRARHYREVARWRLVARARSAPPAEIAAGPRHRLGQTLILLGARLRGVTPPVPEPTPLVDRVGTGPIRE